MSDVVGPVLGPCTSWITGDEVAACPPCADLGSDAAVLLETAAVEASMALYELSGGRFNGVCEATRRPCRTATSCWDPITGSAWSWQYDSISGFWGWWREGERSALCGCQPLSIVKLPGYPVREIVEVKIDGTVLPELDDDGKRNYRLDNNTDLVRMDSPGPPLQRRFWPACQQLGLDDDELGTFSVTYTWGIDPPELGRRAAAQLACELVFSCADGDGNCVLPDGITKITRQGIEVNRQLLLGFFDPTKPTGLSSVDLFIAAYVRSGMVGKLPAAVWSPDVQQFARSTG